MKSINQTLVNALMALSIVGAASCSSAGDPVASDQESPVGVVTALPAVSPSGAISFSGRVESEQTAYISTRVMGAIEKIHVREGDKVLAGQLLVSISNQDLMARRVQAEAAVAEAEAAWNVAQKDQQRFKTLFEQQSVSPKELENVTLQARSAQSRYESATQMLRELEVSLGYTRLKAPFSGVITRKMVDEGSMANPGMPLLILEQGGKLRVSATIPESEIAHVQRGDRVQMTVKSSGKVFPGTILLISPSSQGTGGQYLVKLSIPDSVQKALLSGMYVQASLPRDTGQAVASQSASPLIPLSSIVYRDQLTGVYVVSDDQKAILRWVRLGKTVGDQVEVLSGLSAEERFVVRAEGKLSNGAAVQETNSKY